MIARVFVMNINNADDLPATDQRNRQERFVGVFGQGCKGLKARVFPGSRRQRHNRLVFRYPSRYAFSDPQTDVANLCGVGGVAKRKARLLRTKVRVNKPGTHYNW